MKIKETTPRAFLEEEMRYQLKEAGLKVPEAAIKIGLETIYKDAVIPKLNFFLNKKGLLNIRGALMISLICKKVVEQMKKAGA